PPGRAGSPRWRRAPRGAGPASGPTRCRGPRQQLASLVPVLIQGRDGRDRGGAEGRTPGPGRRSDRAADLEVAAGALTSLTGVAPPPRPRAPRGRGRAPPPRAATSPFT